MCPPLSLKRDGQKCKYHEYAIKRKKKLPRNPVNISYFSVLRFRYKEFIV